MSLELSDVKQDTLIKVLRHSILLISVSSSGGKLISDEKESKITKDEKVKNDA